jgi:ABC-type transport system involved in cytochrome bd biosynthesis fused ATPase/permease subunit
VFHLGVVFGSAAATRHTTGWERAMSTPIICSDLSFGPTVALCSRAWDLSISTGRTGLISANGSGKSTLLRLSPKFPDLGG